MKDISKGEKILLSVIAGYLVFGLVTIGVYAKETGALEGFRGGGNTEKVAEAAEPEVIIVEQTTEEETAPEPEPEPERTETAVTEETKEETAEPEEEKEDLSGLRAGPFYRYTVTEMPFAALNVHATVDTENDEIITHVRTGETGYVVEVTAPRVLVEINGVFGYVADNYVELTEIPDSEYPRSLRELTAETAIAGDTWEEYEDYAPDILTELPNESYTTQNRATSDELTDNGEGKQDVPPPAEDSIGNTGGTTVSNGTSGTNTTNSNTNTGINTNDKEDEKY